MCDNLPKFMSVRIPAIPSLQWCIFSDNIGRSKRARWRIMTADDSNITPREAALIAENARLRNQINAFDSTVDDRESAHDRFWQVSRDMLGVADKHGAWQSVNPAWTTVLGWSAADLLGKTSHWLRHPDDWADSDAHLTSLSTGQPTFNLENRFRTRSGDYRLLNWTVMPINGLLYCVGRDITEEREREIALHDSMDFARLALSAVSGVGVWTYEVASDLFFCDAAIAELYAIDEKQSALGITREGFLANVDPADRLALQSTMAGGLVRSGDLELEYRIRHPDGSTRWVLSRGHTYFDAQGVPVRRTGVGIDMTKQRLLEQQLRQAQKMEAVGQLTGGLAHDFNNLLQGIMGPLELTRRLVMQNRTAGIDRYFDMAMSSAQRAAALTHRLLAFSRRQPLDPKRVEVNHLVTSLGDLLRRTTGEAIRVELVVADEPCITKCDANQLESALLNLVINARDAMPDGGELTVKTSHEYIDDKYAAAQRDVVPGDYICVAVTDTGSGMPPDVVHQAFEPFFTTKPLGQGTGLGLSMVYGFAGQSGGFATIYSHTGLGTTIRIFLPAADGSEADHRAPVTSGADIATGAGETILVVEDDDNVRQLLIDIFEDAGYRVLHATDGPSGLAVLESDAEIDLLVTDVGLPKMNGRQMVDAGRLKRPALRILFMTGYAELASAADGFLGEDMQMITKPFSVEAIANRVQGMLGPPAPRVDPIG